MPTGTIKRYFEDRGFGFIIPDDGGGDVFFHLKSFTAAWGVKPTAKARVEFETGVDPATGRSRAQNVRLV
jgi:CspA family cold shock protein